MKKVLLIDDEIEMLIGVEKILAKKSRFEIFKETNPLKAIELIKSKKYDLIITDLKMEPVSGMEILQAVKNYSSDSKVIMISGYGTIEAGVKAAKEGAFDFIEKPFTSKRLLEAIQAVEKNVEEKNGNVKSSSQISVTEKYGIVYQSKEMAEVVELIEKFSDGDMNILLTGETGVGKEVVARAIHLRSARKDNPFVPINCGAMPEQLFESELFGYERGAFTGAAKQKPGLLEFAEGGTFLFDEIGDMPLSLQTKLLRMLEEKKVRRIGGQNEVEVDVRVIAATNRNLEELIKRNEFRQDLFFRINMVNIEIPSLKERRDDIVLLARYFLSKLCVAADVRCKELSSEAEEMLTKYNWPGNVRELQNIIGRAFYLSNTHFIQSDDLPLPKQKGALFFDMNVIDLNYKEAKSRIVEKFEVEYLSYHLRKNNGNISKTAEQCGIDRRTIHRLINEYNIIYQ
ncbi:MAG: sigma-54-dependent Fis family transcriptional regulator [Chlorobi bacterium]|nr:sigma-54-dependent Fis family transcriptional regulator [Chlorobiota bacterium]